MNLLFVFGNVSLFDLSRTCILSLSLSLWGWFKRAKCEMIMYSHLGIFVSTESSASRFIYTSNYTRANSYESLTSCKYRVIHVWMLLNTDCLKDNILNQLIIDKLTFVYVYLQHIFSFFVATWVTIVTCQLADRSRTLYYENITPVLHGAMGCGQKKLSVAVPPGRVRVPSQRPLAPSITSVTSVANDKGDNEMILGAVHRSPGICLIAEENPRKPQLGDSLMSVCDQSSPQMG